MRSAWLMIVAVCVALGGGRDTRIELRAKHDQRVSAASDLALAIAVRRELPQGADRGACGPSAILATPPPRLPTLGFDGYVARLAPASWHPRSFAHSRSSRGPPIG